MLVTMLHESAVARWLHIKHRRAVYPDTWRVRRRKSVQRTKCSTRLCLPVMNRDRAERGISRETCLTIGRELCVWVLFIDLLTGHRPVTHGEQ